MECFSTDGLPRMNRHSAWNALYSSHVNQVEFHAADRGDFSAQLSLGKLGPLQFADMIADRICIERQRRHISVHGPRRYSFIVQSSGESTLTHCGHEARLGEGDFVLCDSGMPHSFEMGADARILMLRLEEGTIRRHLPTPEQFCGLRLGSTVGLTGTMFAMVRELQALLTRGFTTQYDAGVAHHLLEMLSMTYAIAFDERPDLTALMRVRLCDVTRCIEDNLRDPELSPATLATRLGISPRYLRLIFSGKGERIYAYILRRRLEECAKQIRDPKWSGHTLTEIAFQWGFNSAPHFTRSFHGQFGTTPREYRRTMAN